MNPALKSQLRRLPRNFIKISGTRILLPRVSPRRSFHRSVRLRAADTPPSISGAANDGTELENTRRSEATKKLTKSTAAAQPEVPTSPEVRQEGQNPPRNGPEDVQQASFHGSALRRRQRARSAKELTSSRVAPEWFLDHNVQLRESLSRKRHLRARTVPVSLTATTKGWYEFLDENISRPASERSPSSGGSSGQDGSSKSLPNWKPSTSSDPEEQQVRDFFWNGALGMSKGVTNDKFESLFNKSSSTPGSPTDDAVNQSSSEPRQDSAAVDEPAEKPELSSTRSEQTTSENYQNLYDRLSDELDGPPPPRIERNKESFDVLLKGALSHMDPREALAKAFGIASSAARSETDPMRDRSEGYFIDSYQADEIERTARGLMRLPPEGAKSAEELSVQKAHLLLHYPASGGETVLEGVVQQMAEDLQCDMIAIDPQDISELVASEGLGNEVVADGRLLSYDVHHKEQEEVIELPQAPETPDFDEQDNSEEPGRPSEQNFGTPILIGKPFTLNLSDFMKPRMASRGPSRSGGPSFVRDLFEGRSEKHKPKSRDHIFAPLIESLLSASRHKRAGKEVSKPVSSDTISPESATVTGNGLLIHVRDLKAIQETPIGSQFLNELYEQVTSRRRSREPVMIVGTESATDDLLGNSRSHLQDIQKHQTEEISVAIVVTPVTPNTSSKMTILKNKRKRIATINLRHLWTMLAQKTGQLLYDLQPGFWNRDISEYLGDPDYDCLKEKVWSFGRVHRVVTYIAGSDSVPGYQNRTSEMIIAKAAHDISVSDQSKWEWTDSGRLKFSGPLPGGMFKKVENSRLADIRATATKYEKRLLGGVIEPDKISTTFNDVHAPIETIDALQTLTTLSLVRPDAFKYGVLASDKIPGLLLYGPPGTGKTLLAKAVAKESGATVLEASAADINDMYVGEGEKNVQALFSLAKKLSPCVVFLDEADAMFSARGMSGKRVSHRELLNQFLKEWDGMSNDSGSAFLMVATNRPMDLDDAVLRRLPRRLLVDLPSEADRLEILKIHLRNEALGEDVNLADLATKTPFYSGSDLKNVAVAAALSCVREENDLAKKHKGEEPYKHAEKRTLTAKHFEQALDEISASISEDMSSLREIKKFDEQFGDKRGRKKKSPSFGFRNPAEAEKALDTAKVRA